jgi:hypothetical protein
MTVASSAYPSPQSTTPYGGTAPGYIEQPLHVRTEVMMHDHAAVDLMMHDGIHARCLYGASTVCRHAASHNQCGARAHECVFTRPTRTTQAYAHRQHAYAAIWEYGKCSACASAHTHVQTRVDWWLNCAEQLTSMIQTIIEFAKLIPGFLSLPQDDQIMLLKGGVCIGDTIEHK